MLSLLESIISKGSKCRENNSLQTNVKNVVEWPVQPTMPSTENLHLQIYVSPPFILQEQRYPKNKISRAHAQVRGLALENKIY